jgi:hypothetical protein
MLDQNGSRGQSFGDSSHDGALDIFCQASRARPYAVANDDAHGQVSLVLFDENVDRIPDPLIHDPEGNLRAPLADASDVVQIRMPEQIKWLEAALELPADRDEVRSPVRRSGPLAAPV